ncbi:MAG: hypothetical protein AB7W06_17300 [Alphaproteobacteria bacterium]
MSACPHCHKAIDPPPKRSRKCPHCKAHFTVRRGVILTDAQAEAIEAEEARRLRKSRFREGRAQVVEELREARKSGVVAGFKPLVGDDACRLCLEARDRYFPLADCTVDMLPPYAECECEYGCESTITEVLKSEYDGGLSARKPNAAHGAGCLSAAFLAVVIAAPLMLVPFDDPGLGMILGVALMLVVLCVLSRRFREGLAEAVFPQGSGMDEG